MYGNSTMMTFYSHQAQSVKMQFDMLATTVGSSDNPYAIAHVINFRKNYTAVPYLLEHMINDTRDAVMKTFDFQRRNLGNVMPLVRRTSADVYTILEKKYCNETIMEEFYNNLLYMTSNRVTMSISEGSSAYMSQLMNQYAPFMLFSSFTMQMSMCMYGQGMEQTIDTTSCMVQVIYNKKLYLNAFNLYCFLQKDDLYLGATINLIRESLSSVQAVVENFNLKITDYVVKDIENTFNRAYKDALLTEC